MMLRVVIAVVVLSAGVAQAQTMRWVRRNVAGPSPRGHVPMAYDSIRGECVLFSGFSFPSAMPDTWVWNGSTWTQRVAPGPIARTHHAMTFDSARGVVVMGGGISYVTWGETWEWNGSAWHLAFNSSPAGAQSNAMAFDSWRARTVMVLDSGSARTREWDGIAWTSLPFQFAPLSTDARMCFDSHRGVCVLFGPAGPSVSEYDGNGWIDRFVAGAPGPGPRSEPGLVYDSARGVTVLFGGWRSPINGSGYYSDTWEWNGTVWTRLNVSGPSARAEMAMAYDSIRQKVVLFGGRGPTGAYLGDTWELGPACLACPADINCDGAATSDDVFDYVNAWFAGAALADFDGSSGVTVIDIFEFLNAWLGGC